MKTGPGSSVLLAAFILAPVAEAAPAPPVSATLADVAFMAGHWVGGDPGELSEEVWTVPEGDSMVGMWRFVSGGRTRVFELLTLTPEGPGVVLRLRHFDPKLAAREEKDRPLALALVAKGPREAAFEGPAAGGDGTVRLTYRREGDDALVSVLEKGGSKQEFRFRRR